MAERFVGRGWSFPMGTDPTGRISLAEDNRELEEAIRMILATSPGERPMRPEFGCAISSFVFAPADATTAGRLSAEVSRSITRWEPRIDVRSVDVSVDQERQNSLYIDIQYSKKGSYDPRNLVVPFYVIPEEGWAA